MKQDFVIENHLAVSLHKIHDLFEDDGVVQRVCVLPLLSKVVNLRKTLIHRKREATVEKRHSDCIYTR